MPITVNVLHCGEVCVSPDLPFGGSDCSPVKAAGVFGKRSDRLWLPVSAYLIQHPRGNVLVDTGWERAMSPDGGFDRKAQIASLGTPLLFATNQGKVALGRTVDEQLRDHFGLAPKDLDYVLLTHLDCDHANGLSGVSGARTVMCSEDEYRSASNPEGFVERARYQSKWWEGMGLTTFEWTGTEGPFQHSYDLFGDGSIQLIAIPGHADGQFAVKVTGLDGRFVLLFADGGYATRSWRDLVPSGLANDRDQQMASLEWIREQSLDPLCVESLANHDPDVEPHAIELL